jgi:hypothetical protein
MAPEQEESVERVESRREEMHDMMVRLEHALAAPSGSDRAGWRAEMLVKCDEFGLVLDNHIIGTEGQDGLFSEISSRSPRLISRVDRLRAEHVHLHEASAGLRAALASDPLTDEAIATARDLGLILLTELSRHRQHGADLVYEAYWVDVGGQGD